MEHQFMKNIFAALILRCPLAPRRRWEAHMNHHYPIVKEIYPQNAYGKLCTLRAMDALESGNTRRALKWLEELRVLGREGTGAEKASWAVLAGLYYGQCGNQQQMARHMRWAARYGHDYHLPHAMLCAHYLFKRHLFDRAADEAEQAIDCIYKYPPLTEEKQRIIAKLTADKSLALTMMHRPEEAAEWLRKAEPARDSANYQYAAAMLYAVQGRRESAMQAMEALKALHPERYEHAQANVPMILAGTHPHFTAQTPDEKAIRTYWERFAQEESTLMRLADAGSQDDVFRLHHTFFAPLDTAPPEVDMIALGFKRLEDGTPDFRLVACYSRTYDALITAMLAACPDEIRARWHFTREP